MAAPLASNTNTATATVTAKTLLRLRSSPTTARDNIIGSLRYGQAVEILERTQVDFWRVRVQRSDGLIEGYAAARYLLEAAPPAPVSAQIGEVHLPVRTEAKRSSKSALAFPLAEPGLPRRDPHLSSPQRVAALHRIVTALDVERSTRYLPTNKSTYCNIYAYDYCFLAGVYLPRVWWTSKALIALSQNKAVKVQYGETVQELSANALFDWLGEWGVDQPFGWRRVPDLTTLQDFVNQGRVGVVCAQRRNRSRSGHITCVLPELQGHTAQRTGATVTGVLQSQAGTLNKQLFTNAWWVDRSHVYAETGFWVHD
jgi:hypothetical protein